MASPALVIFNRDAQISTVLEQVPARIAAHSCFKRTIAQSEAAGFARCCGNQQIPTASLR